MDEFKRIFMEKAILSDDKLTVSQMEEFSEELLKNKNRFLADKLFYKIAKSLSARPEYTEQLMTKLINGSYYLATKEKCDGYISIHYGEE